MPDAGDAGESGLATTKHNLKFGGLFHWQEPLEGKDHNSAIPAESVSVPAGTFGWAKTVTAITAQFSTWLILAIPSK